MRKYFVMRSLRSRVAESVQSGLTGDGRFGVGVKRKFGRGERIRTSDPLRPRQVRYQAALRPDWFQL
jgi:hypothetical protein